MKGGKFPLDCWVKPCVSRDS